MDSLSGRRDSRRWTIYACPDLGCGWVSASRAAAEEHAAVSSDNPDLWPWEPVEVVPAVPDGEAVELRLTLNEAHELLRHAPDAPDRSDVDRALSKLHAAILGGEG